ncbi:MAG: hypothetical protein NTX98_02310 [Candidatus Doudnabacteria bacterium]|nr:hypothetical protein [Candidatus Doudnabacteria bacterium]
MEIFIQVKLGSFLRQKLVEQGMFKDLEEAEQYSVVAPMLPAKAGEKELDAKIDEVIIKCRRFNFVPVREKLKRYMKYARTLQDIFLSRKSLDERFLEVRDFLKKEFNINDGELEFFIKRYIHETSESYLNAAKEETEKQGFSIDSREGKDYLRKHFGIFPPPPREGESPREVININSKMKL